ncbi:hypothetical protein F4820DRAFT_407338 [Hypoxylon rubiginosum]|uniref:Uncharacterized protein n=1 Tax=Hypoxylon rubiginosum TaxID=110542 RepID=A0ACB9ZC69_9PEZI|nr:hypothetical protein F4820DRAFT_407338 [Hypoxylon rubiginosum]
MVYNARLGMEIFQLGPTSLAAMNQRKRKAGRAQPGVCFRLYTKAAEADASELTKPAVRTKNLNLFVLQAIEAGTPLDKSPQPTDPPPAPFFNEADPKASKYGPDTAESLMHNHKRPARAGLGWCGYDRFHEWQSRGLHISSDMVKEEK